MSQLLDELIVLIEDEVDEDFTDGELIIYLNKYRNYLDEISLTAENDDYLVWLCNYKYLDNRILTDGTNNFTETTDYIADDINGIYTFSAAQSAVYIKANYYDLYKTASDIWLVRAARAGFNGRVRLGDEELPADKYNKSYCIGKYWDLRPSDSNEMERG